MTSPFDQKVWGLPKWLHYALAILLALSALLFRGLLQPTLGTKAPFGLSIIPVAIVAYAGGFGPGMLAAAIGIVGATILFVEPRFTLAVDKNLDLFQIAITCLICLFISAIAGRLRNTARRNSRLASQVEIERGQLVEVLESITDPFFSVDRSWTILHTNEAYRKLVKPITDSNLVGHKLWEVFPGREEGVAFRVLNRVMDTRASEAIEVENPQTGAWYQVRAFPTALGISVFHHDITQSRRMEESKNLMLANERAARSAAEEASRLKDEFLATLSHELRTPMTALLGWAELLNRGEIPKSRLEEGLASIEQSARTQAKLVDELLDLSRINAGKLKVDMDFLDLGEIASEALQIHLTAAKAKGVRLLLDESPEPAVVRGDQGRLHQVFSNLLSNAIKFTPPGGEVTMRVYVEKDTSCFSVTDNGEGIDPDFLPHVFDRFRQANASTTRRHGGLGLGLAIARQLVELHGGTIEPKSDGKGSGTSFNVCLPFAKLNSDALRAVTDIAAPRLDGVTVLLVEDDDATRLMLTRALESQGCVVLGAENAAVAMATLEKSSPDIMVSDIGMPEMDGYALATQVRDLGHTLPLIALTAFARDTDRIMAKRAGFDAFLSKPVNISQFLMVATDLLKERP